MPVQAVLGTEHGLQPYLAELLEEGNRVLQTAVDGCRMYYESNVATMQRAGKDFSICSRPLHSLFFSFPP